MGWVAILLVHPLCGAADSRHPSLEADVQPLLKARCIKCHAPLKPKGKLNLSSPRSLVRGGESGPAVVPGSLEESVLWEKVASDEMPPRPEEPLSGREKGILRQWIEAGAAGLPRAAELNAAGPGADHWAFAPASRPEPPRVRDSSQVRTPVDRFILSALEEKSLTLGPQADRATLLRRLSFDLTGLPPAAEEIQEFIADRRPDAFERQVDRLLASPRYGERWGKFWLDAMGYVESNGYFSADSERPLAYHFRDYVIRASSADRPLDQVVREQLAGDELAGYRPGGDASPSVIDQLVATHFLRNGQDGTGESDGNPDEVRADKVAVLDGAVQIIGSSLLGLTLQCAKCHDHKFEPVTQKEYYQLHSILYPAFNVDKWVKPNDRVVAAAPRALTAAWEAHEKEVDAEVARLGAEMSPKPNDSPQEKEKKRKALKQALAKANAKRRPQPGRIAWVADLGPEPVQAPLLIRGNPSTPGPALGPGVPAFLADPDNPYDARPPSANARSTGRRLALARWLTRPGSRPAALLARVLANRIWQHHFGNRTGRDIRQPRLHRISAHAPRASGIPGRRAGSLGLECQGAPSSDLRAPRSGVNRANLYPRPSRLIPTIACWRGFPCAGSMPKRFAMPCWRFQGSSTAVRAGHRCRPIERNRVKSWPPSQSPAACDGLSIYSSIEPGSPPCLKSLTRLRSSRPVPAACPPRSHCSRLACSTLISWSPAQASWRRGWNVNALRKTALIPGSTAPTCWPLADLPRISNARPRDGSCRLSPLVIPSSRRPTPGAAPGLDFCQMVLASNAFLYVE